MIYIKRKKKKLLQKVIIKVSTSDEDFKISRYREETPENQLIDEYNERLFNDEIYLITKQNFE